MCRHRDFVMGRSDSKSAGIEKSWVVPIVSIGRNMYTYKSVTRPSPSHFKWLSASNRAYRLGLPLLASQVTLELCQHDFCESKLGPVNWSLETTGKKGGKKKTIFKTTWVVGRSNQSNFLSNSISKLYTVLTSSKSSDRRLGFPFWDWWGLA